MNFLLNVEWAIFQWVEQTLWNPILDTIMTIITRLGDGGWFWILLTLILLAMRPTRRLGVAAAIGLLCSLIINDGILKNLIQRPRPFDLSLWQGLFQYPELIPRPESFSFPSGHSCSSLAAATGIWMGRKNGWTAALLVLAVLIAFSRIYLHVHYPTDVLMGSLLGVVYGMVGWYLAGRLPKGFYEARLGQR